MKKRYRVYEVYRDGGYKEHVETEWERDERMQSYKRIVLFCIGAVVLFLISLLGTHG